MLYTIGYKINFVRLFIINISFCPHGEQSYQFFPSPLPLYGYITGCMTTMVQSRHSCNRLSEPVVAVPALKGEEKNQNLPQGRQTHTQGRFLVILTVRHSFLPYAKEGKKKKKSPLPLQIP